MNGFQQTIIIRRSELRRLDLAQLEQILNQINQLKREKGEIKGAMWDDIVSKFYSTLKTVSS